MRILSYRFSLGGDYYLKDLMFISVCNSATVADNVYRFICEHTVTASGREHA